MVSRREKSRTGENKSPTIKTQKDKRKLIVVSYLISLGEKRANRHQITNKIKLRKQEPGDFKQLMNELVVMNWIDSETREDDIDWYTYTENGRDALNEAKKLARENHPLAALEIFEDILDF